MKRVDQENYIRVNVLEQREHRKDIQGIEIKAVHVKLLLTRFTNVCDKFYVWANMLEGQLFTMPNTIQNDDISKMEMLGQL